MPRFDRFDICEAHYLYARHFHQSGDTPQRDFERLHRIGFAPGGSLVNHDDPDKALTENGAAIYRDLCRRVAKWCPDCDAPWDDNVIQRNLAGIPIKTFHRCKGGAS